MTVRAKALLDTWANDPWSNGVQVDQLRELDTLAIQTLYHTYEVIVINPSTADVLIRGGEFFPERTPAHISGATLRGSFLKLRGIYVGFNLEVLSNGRTITTSPVKSIGIVTE